MKRNLANLPNVGGNWQILANFGGNLANFGGIALRRVNLGYFG